MLRTWGLQGEDQWSMPSVPDRIPTGAKNRGSEWKQRAHGTYGPHKDVHPAHTKIWKVKKDMKTQKAHLKE